MMWMLRGLPELACHKDGQAQANEEAGEEEAERGCHHRHAKHCGRDAQHNQGVAPSGTEGVAENSHQNAAENSPRHGGNAGVTDVEDVHIYVVTNYLSLIKNGIDGVSAFVTGQKKEK